MDDLSDNRTPRHRRQWPAEGATQRSGARTGARSGGTRTRWFTMFAAALAALVLATTTPLQSAGADDEPVFDTRDGKAPYISVVFPDGAHDTVFQGSVPVTVNTNVYLSAYSTSEFEVRTNPYMGASRFRILDVASHTYDLSNTVTGTGESWIHWNIVGRNGERYQDSRPVRIQKAFDDPVVWQVPANDWWANVPKDAKIEAKYTCHDYPGYVVVSCGWKGPEPEYIYTGTAGQRYARAHMRVRNLATGEETDWAIERIYQVGKPEHVTVGLTFEQQSWQTGEWMPIPDTKKVVEGTPVRAVATVANTTDDEQDVELKFGTFRPNTSGGVSDQHYDIPGAAANIDLDAKEIHVERYQLSPELLTAWNADGSANMKPRLITVGATSAQSQVGDSSEVVTVPRPVVLVHGYKSNAASSWGEYQSIMARSHPNLRAYAVGDGQFPGVMNTGSEEHPFTRTNTIAENAAQEDTYIDGVRKATNAWNVDIVAHSMGGLISRYYVQELMDTTPKGTNVVNRLVQLGTPNRGSQLADVLLAGGWASPKAIPLYPASLQLSTGYIDDLYNKLITDMRGVPISNLVGTDIPLLGLPQFAELWGDGIVPEYSARWNLEDTFSSYHDLHTAMTENVDDFTKYVLPRIRQNTPSTGEAARTAHAKGVTTQTTIVDPGDGGCTDCDPDGGTIEWADPAVEEIHEVTIGAGQTVTIPFTIPELWAVGALSADADLTMEIVHPDGEWTRHSEDGPNDLFTSVGAPYPDAGTWQVKVTNPTGSDRTTSVALFVAGSPLKVETSSSMRSDGTSLVEATVTDRLRPLKGATVEAVITDGTPAAGARTSVADVKMALVDDGTNGDRTAGDGVYSAITPKLAPGTERAVAVHTTSSIGNRYSSSAVAAKPSKAPQERFDLKVTTEGQGTVKVDPQQADYAEGDVVTLKASAADGWDFAGWSVDGVPSEAAGDLVLAMDGDTSVVARFVEEPQVPRNVAPMIDMAATASVAEGSTLTIDGSFVDPDDDAWTATVDLGNGKGAVPLALDGKNFTIRGVYPQDGPRTIVVNIDDGEDRTSAQVAVDVTNVAPSVTLTGDATRTVVVGTAVNLSGTYTDPGTADTHTAAFVVGTGTGAVTVPATVSNGTVTASHTFTAAGTYPVSLTVTDDAGAATTSTAIGAQPVTVVVTAAPTQTPKEKVLKDFDNLVAQQKVTSTAAKTLRSILATACDAHAKRNKAGVTVAMAAYDVTVGLAKLLKELNSPQAKALADFGTQVKSQLR